MQEVSYYSVRKMTSESVLKRVPEPLNHISGLVSKNTTLKYMSFVDYLSCTLLKYELHFIITSFIFLTVFFSDELVLEIFLVLCEDFLSFMNS